MPKSPISAIPFLVLFYNNGIIIIIIMLVAGLMVTDQFKWICKAAIVI